MHPAMAAGRWALAFCVAAIVCTVGSAFVSGFVRGLLHAPQHSAVGYSTAFCVGIFAGMWAGASTLPRDHRKVFSMVLGGILAAAIFVFTTASLASGSFSSGEIVPILGTALGFRWIIRVLWPKWSTGSLNFDDIASAPVPAASVSAPRAVIIAKPTPRRAAAQSARTTFGKRS